MRLPFHTLDVFTQDRFRGNPLAVVRDADRLGGGEMQAIAREFNLSETVFVLAPEDAAHTARVRIFTPVGELPFAGHPTIGTAVLLARLATDAGSGDAPITLEEEVGLVTVAVRDRGASAPFAELTAAVLPTPGAEPPSAVDLASALGLAAADIGFEGYRPSVYEAGNGFLFVPLASRAALARARPDPAKSRSLGALVGLYLFCRGTDPRFDFHARMFAAGGIWEDPATGSAAATLPGPLCAQARVEDGTRRWRIAQGEDMGRPSALFLEADVVAGRPVAVRVGGHAVEVSSGEIET
jgi:trans-2,3-dihydro-3-hydroxyanthranilate isomerase